MYYIIIFCNFQNLKTVNDFWFLQLSVAETTHILKVSPFSSYQLGNGGIYFNPHPLLNAVIPGYS